MSNDLNTMIRPCFLKAKLRQQTHLSADTQVNDMLRGPVLWLLQNQRIIALMAALCMWMFVHDVSANEHLFTRGQQELNSQLSAVININCPAAFLQFQKVSAESYWTDWNCYEMGVRAQHFVVIDLWTAALLHYEWASDCVLKWLAWDNDKLIIGPWRFKSLWKSYKSWQKILFMHFMFMQILSDYPPVLTPPVRIQAPVVTAALTRPLPTTCLIRGCSSKFWTPPWTEMRILGSSICHSFSISRRMLSGRES